MATWFDESRLDDETALATADLRLRELAEAGARVRREAVEAAPGIAAAVAAAGDVARPRAIVAAGPDSRLLRAVLEPWCPVPFVAWPGPGAARVGRRLSTSSSCSHPTATDRGTAAAVAEAVRRGCQVVVACPAELAGRPPRRGPLVDDRADRGPRPAGHRRRRAGVPRPGRARARGPTTATSPTRSTTWPSSCSPHRDLAVNPAKMLAIALADTNPVVWGGSVAGRPRRAPGRRDDPSGHRPVGDRRRRRAPAAADRGRPPPRRVRRPLRRRRGRRPADAAGLRRRHRRPRRPRGPRTAARRGRRARRPRRDGDDRGRHRDRALRLARAQRAGTPRSTSASAWSATEPPRRHR